MKVSIKGKYLFFGTGIFVFGILIGLLGNEYVLQDTVSREQGDDSSSHQVRQNGNYSFINPLLECEISEGSLNARNENFHDSINTFVEDLKQQKALTNAAVYFRDLNNGPTSGVNSNEEFFPASLLKVPVMMVFYHLAEKDPSILQVQIMFEKKQDFGVTPTIIPKEELVVGQSYTIEELIRRMIVYSDNQSLALLSARVPRAPLNELFQMLGVGEDVIMDSEAKLSVKEYAGFFRILFNSSYLEREYSEKALKLLSQTDYNEALVAGVPGNVVTSHKFGEAGTLSEERQLHDCGIVYYPNHPYLICIMTRGYSPSSLKESIKEISQFTFDRVKAQYE